MTAGKAGYNIDPIGSARPDAKRADYRIFRARRVIFIIAFIVFYSLIFTDTVSQAIEADIKPFAIKPGDPFLITVVSSENVPEARANGKSFAFGSCGDGCYIALGAMEAGAKPGMYGVEIISGAEKRTLNIKVEKAAFPVQRITLPSSKVFLSAQDQKRADEEQRVFDGIWNTVTPEVKWEGGFIMPLANELSTAFGAKRIMNGKKTSTHLGVDITGKTGENILAANAGAVVLAFDTFYGGNTVVIDHGLGVYTLYMHLSETHVKEGDVVKKGDVVGLVGSTGRATGPHLHYALKINKVAANPISITKIALDKK